MIIVKDFKLNADGTASPKIGTTLRPSMLRDPEADKSAMYESAQADEGMKAKK